MVAATRTLEQLAVWATWPEQSFGEVGNGDSFRMEIPTTRRYGRADFLEVNQGTDLADHCL